MHQINKGISINTVICLFLTIIIHGGAFLYVSGGIGSSPYSLWFLEGFLLIPLGLVFLFFGIRINKKTNAQSVLAILREGSICGIITSVLTWIVILGAMYIITPPDQYISKFFYLLFPLAVLLPYSIAITTIGGLINQYRQHLKKNKQILPSNSSNGKSIVTTVFLLIFMAALVLGAIVINSILIQQEEPLTKEWYDYYYPDTPVIGFNVLINNTLNVCYVEGNNLSWENVEIRRGNGTLPQGIIDKSDKIFNCSGKVIVFWKPTQGWLGSFDFPLNTS